MNELVLWKKKKLNEIKKEIDRLFEVFYKDFTLPFERLIQEPIFTIDDQERDLVVRARLDNASFSNIHLSIFEDRIILTGRGYMKKETPLLLLDESCAIRKTLKLPCRVKPDEAQATYQDGILNINLPKKHVGEKKKVLINIL